MLSGDTCFGTSLKKSYKSRLVASRRDESNVRLDQTLEHRTGATAASQTVGQTLGTAPLA